MAVRRTFTETEEPMTPTTEFPPPRRSSSRRRRAINIASIALVAGLVGSGVALGVDHAAGLASSGGAAVTTPSGSASSGTGASPGASGGTLGPPSGSGYGGGYGGGYSGGYGSGSYPGGSSGVGSSSSGSATSSPTPGAGAPADVSGIAAKVAPALVDVNSTFSYQSEAGAGTGVVITSNGEVITNNHVVNGATSISVTDVGNGKTYHATVAGYDASHDIAVLQLQGASGLTTASIGDSSKASVGEPIVAVGNAGGTGGTPTSAGGSITALDQSLTAGDDLNGTSEQLGGMIEVNADVQPGDSGGSLVNSAGQVVGIDTAGSSGSTSVDYSAQATDVQAYAVPINTALALAQQIEAGQGTSTIHVGETAFLGVETSATDAQGTGGYGGGYGFSGGGSASTGSSGVTIAGLVSGSAAAQAGLAEGDTITSFDGQTVSSPSDLTKLLVPLHPGDKVQVGWTDSSGQSHTGTVVLGSGPSA